MITLYAELVAFANDLGGYINYVFKNLESDSWDNKYILCTQYPNWDQSPLKVGDIGYLTYTEIIGGTSYYSIKDRDTKIYGYTHNRFDRFIQERETDDNKIVI